MALAWAFVAGWPLGLLGLLAAGAVGAEPDLRLLLAGSGGGVALAGAVWLLSRRGGWDPDRRARLARGASASLLALPASGLALLGLAPGPLASLGLVLAALAAALVRALRGHGPGSPMATHAGRCAAALAVFAALLVGAASISAGLGGAPPALDASLGDAVLDADARVALAPEVACAPRAASVEVLASAGAHPRLEGGMLWFDAAHEGRRQLFRLGLEDGRLQCFTCDEPGNNRRPTPAPGGRAVVFDTDRHRSLLDPANTEIHAIAVGAGGPVRASRRLTHAPGPDDRAIYDPSGIGIVWSSSEGSGFVVRRAAIRSGHGGVILTGERRLEVGRRRFVTPLAWSVDGRALVIGRGHPLRPFSADAFDAASGRRTPLGDDLAGPAAVSFSVDASRMALAATRASGARLLVPDALGFLVGRIVAALGSDPAGAGATRVRIGPTAGELRGVDLGTHAAWGEPTGVALSASGEAFVLGQRRPGRPVEERILRVQLACGDAPRQAGVSRPE